MTVDNRDEDDLGLPPVEDASSTGAAADSSDLDGRLAALPRLLRYAMLTKGGGSHIQERLIAEIDEICPGLAETVLWATVANATTGLALAAELDRQASSRDIPTLRSLSDCVRLLCLPLPRSTDTFADYRRVGKALIGAFRRVCRTVERVHLAA